MICYIICAMPPQGEQFTKNADDLVIAADAGMRYASEYKLKPDLAVGDFDSLGSLPESIEVVRHPAEKDDTDLMLAVKIGLSRGYRTFCILGAMGGRADHAFAVYQTLAYLDAHSAVAYLYGEGMAVTLMRSGQIELPSFGDRLLSVFAFGGDAKGVTLEGVHYPLQNATLAETFPLGVSNVITEDTARIRLGQGRLLLFWRTSADFLAKTEQTRELFI